LISRGVKRCPNTVLHSWLQEKLEKVVKKLPMRGGLESEEERHRSWRKWQEGLKMPFTLPQELPPLRMLLIMDNLQGHKTPEFVLWLVAHGIMPLYTPIAGSWLNMAESMQNIVKKRALNGQHPETADETIKRLEEATQSWNRHPTSFVWGGKRAERRKRRRERQKCLKGSGANVDDKRYRSINHYIHAN
jgi:hypothetical protein